MKPYKQDATEIMARGKAAYRRKKNARRAILGMTVILLVAAALGVWKHFDIGKIEVNESEPGSSAALSSTEAPENDPTQPPAQTQAADPGSTVAPGDTAPAETGYIPPWQEAPCYIQYPTLQFEGRVYQTTGVPIDPASAAETLGEAALSGYDVYAEESHSQSVPVSRIGNINTECAVCAVLADGNTYAYVNAYYTPETLGQFIADLDLKNTLVFGEAYAEERAADGNVTFYKFTDFDDTLLWNGLLADESLKNEPNRAYGIRLIGFSANVPALGYENKSLWITEDGCIVTNILESAKVFYIGPAAAESFIAQLKNAVPYEAQENATFTPEEGVPE